VTDVVAAEVAAGTEPDEEGVPQQRDVAARSGDSERLALSGPQCRAAPEQLLFDRRARPVAGGHHIRTFGAAVDETDPRATGSLLDAAHFASEPQAGTGTDRGVAENVDHQFAADRDHRISEVLLESQREPGEDLPVGESHFPVPEHATLLDHSVGQSELIEYSHPVGRQVDRESEARTNAPVPLEDDGVNIGESGHCDGNCQTGNPRTDHGYPHLPPLSLEWLVACDEVVRCNPTQSGCLTVLSDTR